MIRKNFIYPNINDDHRNYGGSFLLEPIINPSGDWRKSLPPEEEQRRYNVEPSSCFVEAPQHTIATIEEYAHGEPDNNYSARFNALLADGGEWGGDPLKGADSIRHDGLVKEKSMPHGSNITSWSDYHSWKGVNEETVRQEGQNDLARKTKRFGILVEKDYPLEAKYRLIEQGLQRSPAPMSLWGAVDASGNYLEKPEGTSDTHMVEAVYLDRATNQIHINDTYPPFQKVLPPNYNFDFAMGWVVEKKLYTLTWWEKLLKIIMKLFQ